MTQEKAELFLRRAVESGWLDRATADASLREYLARDGEASIVDWITSSGVLEADACDHIARSLATSGSDVFFFEGSETDVVTPPGSPGGGLPETIGRFVVERELGRGAMGVVCKAKDPLLGADVAIKVLSPRAIGGKKGRRQMLEEARNAAVMRDHPNVVTVYEAMVDGPTPYVAMEYVDGSNLADVVETNPDRATRRRMLQGIAEGLAEAHARGSFTATSNPPTSW